MSTNHGDNMTKDGFIQDVNEKTRQLMQDDFNEKQAQALFGFVNEQIKDYCHSKVDQRIFEKKLDERFKTFHTKVDQRRFEDYLEEKFKVFEQDQKNRFDSLTTIFHTKEEQKLFEVKLNERFDSLTTIFHTKEEQKIFEVKLDERFTRIESKLEELSQAILILTRAISK